jgi:hypothetical protein
MAAVTHLLITKYVLQKKTVTPDKGQKFCPVQQDTPRHYNTRFNNLAIIWKLIPRWGWTPRRTGRQMISRNVPDPDCTTDVWLRHAESTASKATGHSGSSTADVIAHSHSYSFHGRHALTNYWTNNFFNRSEYIFLRPLTINHWREL